MRPEMRDGRAAATTSMLSYASFGAPGTGWG